MESTLMWTSTTSNQPSFTILICRDRKCLCEALLSLNPCISFIHDFINSIFSSIYIQWIPRHSDILGNELVYKAAKEAFSIVTNTILPVYLSSSLQVINDKIPGNSLTHDRVAQMYQYRNISCDSKTSTSPLTSPSYRASWSIMLS